MTIENLTRLIHSLSGPEKRQFKMACRKQEGAKDYLGLFDIIEQSSLADTDSIKTQFAQRYPQSVIYNTTRYLGKLLTDTLIQGKMEKDPVFGMLQDIMRVKVLHDRSLHDDAQHLLRRIKQRANEAQQHTLEYYVSRQELDYISESALFQLEDRALIDTQMNAKDILKRLNNIQDHHSLFEVLKYRLLHSGKISSDKDRKQLNDLILSEMILVSGKSKNSFAAQKLHLLFQSFFFTDVGDDHSALQTFYNLSSLFENNIHLLEKPPQDYLLTLTGIVDSLHTLRQFEKIPYFLERLSRLDHPDYPEYFRWRVRKSLVTYQMLLFCEGRKFQEAIAYWQQEGIPALKQYPFINEERQWELYFYSSLAYHQTGERKKAHAGIRQAMTQHKLQPQWMVCKAIRLLEIIIHYELGDTDYLEHDIRSYRRFFRKRDELLKTETLVLKFVIADPLRMRARPDQKSMNLYEQDMAQLNSDKYEIQLLKYFDFIGWLSQQHSLRTKTTSY